MNSCILQLNYYGLIIIKLEHTGVVETPRSRLQGRVLPLELRVHKKGA